jgi:hypothetical protein
VRETERERGREKIVEVKPQKRNKNGNEEVEGKPSSPTGC